MQMIERQVGGVTILDLHGALTLDEGTERLGDRIRDLVLQQRTSVVLNLAGIRYVDSDGLGQLITCHTSLARAAGGLRLLHIGKRTARLLSITRLVTVFATFDSEDAAVKSFPELLTHLAH
jgi:anti-sigma B factor antagonist